MAASGNVAIVFITAQAASTTRNASGHPLPSPSRMPSWRQGFRPSSRAAISYPRS